MDSRTEARDFLQSRRAKLVPEQTGLRTTDTRRRVPGLRREEVALLAGVSVDYYTRLEKGRLETASEEVLDAIAAALQLSTAERSHLLALAKATRGGAGEPEPHLVDPSVRPSIDWLLGAMSHSPAYVRNGRLDVLAANGLGRALYASMFDSTVGTANLARFCFLEAAAQSLFPQWSEVARETVALLRAELGRCPGDPQLHTLIRDLDRGSERFRELWSRHDVSRVLAESKLFEHPVVGSMTLALEALEIAADPGLTMVAYAAEPGSASELRMVALAS